MRSVVAAAVMLFGMASAAAASAANLPLLPMPASVEAQRGSFSLAGASISANEPGERAAAERLRDLLRRSGGATIETSAKGRIRFRKDASVAGAEAYRLRVSPAGIDIAASTDAGLFYGAETLWQLIASSGTKRRIAAVDIEDCPALAWRGVMLDSVRHMQPVAYVEQLIDRMAMAKLNTLQWHLTDDQGWRIEIKRYPRLTSIGAWRQEAGAAGVDGYGRPLRYGGFYTQAQIREVVEYARRHHVTVVPEIEMPGHATAMIAAYPQLASVPDPPRSPSRDWGILPNLLSPADSTFDFIEHVLDEVMPLFPGPFVHVGGDEAVKDQWKTNAVAQARIKALGLKDEDALQGWFTARVGDYLHRHGKRLIGWDEIMQGNVPADAAITSWHGIDGAVAAARSGHDAVLAPAPDFYVDNRQGESGNEPPGRGELVSWRRLYQFDTSLPSISAEQRRHLLGMQVNLWTEHVRTTDYAERMIWPRAAILAELAWSNPRRDWAAFAPRLIASMERWRAMKLGADWEPLQALATFREMRDGLSVTLRQSADIGSIHYTVDGTRVTARSPGYAGPFVLRKAGRLTAQSFLGSQPLGSPETWTIDPKLARTRSASEMELCGNAIPLRLEDDGATDETRLVHWVDIMHPCWIWRGAALDGIRTVTAHVGGQPFNFAIGNDVNNIKFEPPATPEGELRIRRDGCDGPVIATIPLKPAIATSGDAWVSGTLSPQSGAHDLCMTFTQKSVDPFWVLDRLTLQ